MLLGIMWPFGRKDAPRQVVDVSLEEYGALCRKVGRLEAAVESQTLVWENYRDQLNRLVTRLEKRDQRAKKATEEPEEAPPPPISAAARRILYPFGDGGRV